LPSRIQFLGADSTSKRGFNRTIDSAEPLIPPRTVDSASNR
jgi:hypothetical protein